MCSCSTNTRNRRQVHKFCANLWHGNAALSFVCPAKWVSIPMLDLNPTPPHRAATAASAWDPGHKWSGFKFQDNKRSDDHELTKGPSGRGGKSEAWDWPWLRSSDKCRSSPVERTCLHLGFQTGARVKSSTGQRSALTHDRYVCPARQLDYLRAETCSIPRCTRCCTTTLRLWA